MSNTQEPYIRFHKARFVEAVAEVIARCESQPERLGRARLHAALFYADMTAYLDRAEPVTGVDYIKEPSGPAARYLDWALDVLEKDGRLTVSPSLSHGMPMITFAVREKRPSNELGEYERRYLWFWTDWVCGFNHTDFDHICHREPWSSVDMWERIPYASAFLLLPPRRAPKAELLRKTG